MSGSNQPHKNRRTFIKQTGGLLAGAGLGLALPTIVPRSVLAGSKEGAPSDRINVGIIGVRNQGGGNLGRVLDKKFEKIARVIAVCDVDTDVLAMGKARVEKASKSSCQAYGDYRKLLDDKDIDAVVISTPDHWHGLITVDACMAGKDVYCEKPLSLTIADGQAMVNAARKMNRIVQTGSQQRSDDGFRRACELVRNGKLGKIHTVRCGISGVNLKGEPVPDSDPPQELDFDFWLGPAPKRPYNAQHVHYNFRFFWDYSGGQMTNWGAHHLDIAQWGLGTDDTGPVSIEGQARYNKDNLFEVPEWCEAIHHYANGVKLIVGQSEKGGTTFEGTKGTLHVDRKGFTCNPKELADSPISAGDTKLYASTDHFGNWFDCIKSRDLPICDVGIGHRSASMCHLGNIAIRLGRKLNWDPIKEEFVGDQAANEMIARRYRAPWKNPIS
ncbi:MAG TPA: Gfo/Idh/MocA family oxidoreductase [Pirellulales bacterium]|jgi:predicted dehydrogenase